VAWLDGFAWVLQSTHPAGQSASIGSQPLSSSKATCNKDRWRRGGGTPSSPRACWGGMAAAVISILRKGNDPYQEEYLPPERLSMEARAAASISGSDQSSAPKTESREAASEPKAKLPPVFLSGFAKNGRTTERLGQPESSLTTLLEGVQALIQAQRVVMREAESRFRELETHGGWLEAQVSRVADEAGGLGLADRGREDLGSIVEAVREVAAEAVAEAAAEAATSVFVPHEGNGNGTFIAPDTNSITNSTEMPTELQVKDSLRNDQTQEPGSGSRSNRANTVLLRMQEEEQLEEEQRRASVETMIVPKWKQMVRSPKFDLALGGLIVANTVCMCLQIEYNGRILQQEIAGTCQDENCDNARWPIVEFGFLLAEQFFTIIFALELTLRLMAEGRRYLKTVGNIGDAMIVVVSGIDSWVLTPIGSQGVQNVAILRLVRLVRLSKVLRVVRVMKAFKSLRVLVSAVANSVGALAWSMTLLFVLELIGAIFLAQVLQPIIAEPNQEDTELREFLCRKFGTWLHAMLSLFEITMAPGGFIGYRRLYEEVHPLLGLFIVIYVCVVTFAVVRVITAMFLKATLSASDNDEARVARDKAEQREAYAKRLREQIDLDGGYIDEQEFELLCQVPRMKEWLEDALLNQEGAMRLFHAMDRGSGQVVFSDFIAALLRIRGGPKGADSIIMLYENNSIIDEVKKLQQMISGNRSSLIPLFPNDISKEPTQDHAIDVEIHNKFKGVDDDSRNWPASKPAYSSAGSRRSDSMLGAESGESEGTRPRQLLMCEG